MLSVLINEVAEKWPAYHAGKRTDKNARVHELIVREIPELLTKWLKDDPMYLCSGSDGQGNLLQAPWFAVFNRNITESAQRGYYVVFLFSEDMSNLILEIGFGATQFKEKFGTGKEFFTQLDRAVDNMRTNSKHLFSEHLKFSLNRTNQNEVKLDLSGNFNLRSYEKCAIYSIVYEISNLTDEVLRNDFDEYINLFMYASRVMNSHILDPIDFMGQDTDNKSIRTFDVINKFTKDEKMSILVGQVPEYTMYFKMLKLGIPRDAVKQKMTLLGIDARVLDYPEHAPYASVLHYISNPHLVYKASSSTPPQPPPPGLQTENHRWRAPQHHTHCRPRHRPAPRSWAQT